MEGKVLLCNLSSVVLNGSVDCEKLKLHLKTTLHEQTLRVAYMSSPLIYRIIHLQNDRSLCFLSSLCPFLFPFYSINKSFLPSSHLHPQVFRSLSGLPSKKVPSLLSPFLLLVQQSIVSSRRTIKWISLVSVEGRTLLKRRTIGRKVKVLWDFLWIKA